MKNKITSSSDGNEIDDSQGTIEINNVPMDGNESEESNTRCLERHDRQRKPSISDSELDKGVSHFDWKEISIRIVFLGLYLFDVATDFISAYVHYENNDHIFFVFTLLFIIVPGFASSAVSCTFYLYDEKKEGRTWRQRVKRWTVIWLFLITMISPVLKDIDSLRYGYKMISTTNKKKQKKYLERMNKEDQDKYLLKYLLALLEDGPQLILQLVSMVSPSTHNTTFDHIKLLIGMVFSFIGLSVANACLQRNIMKSKKTHQLTWPATAVIAVWTLFFLIARVLALGLVAIMYPIILTCILLIRYTVMNVWIAILRKGCGKKGCLDVLHHAMISAVLIFVYLKSKETPTALRQFIYYYYTFVENLSLMLLWFFTVDPSTWYRVPAMLIHFLTYFAGVILLVVYYTCFHPMNDPNVLEPSNVEKGKIWESLQKGDDLRPSSVPLANTNSDPKILSDDETHCNLQYIEN